MRTAYQDVTRRRRFSGLVSGNQPTTSGDGWMATRTGTGTYIVRFTDSAFVPLLILAVAYPGGSLSYHTVVYGASAGQFQASCHTTNTNALTDSTFYFEAEGR